MKIIRAHFIKSSGNKTDFDYAYRSWRDDIQVGQYIVVESPATGMSIAIVSTVYTDLTDAAKATKWIVNIIDTEQYNHIMGAEQRRKDLLSELSRREKVLSEADRYRRLAAIDPEAAKLVEELDRLNMQYAPAIEHVSSKGVPRNESDRYNNVSDDEDRYDLT